MRIRVGVRFRLSAGKSSGRDGNEGGRDTDASRSPYCWIRQGDVSSLETTGVCRLTSATAAADGAAQRRRENTSAADESLPATVSGAGRTEPATEHASTGTGRGLVQGEQNVWQNVTDFWFFADVRTAPTIGNLKQRLLQSLLQGVVALPPGFAALLARAARDFQCYQQQSPPLYSDSLWHSVQFPLRGRPGPQVVLRLQGALLPDDQPLHLLERDDHVELCISNSSMPLVTADGTATLYAPPEAFRGCRKSFLFSHSAHSVDEALDSVRAPPTALTSPNKGFLSRRSSFVGSGDSGICECCRPRCNSTQCKQRRVVSRRQRRTHKTSAAVPLQHDIGKRRRVHGMQQRESSSASLTCLDRHGGNAAVHLQPASRVATSSAPSAERKTSTTAVQKKVKQTAHASCKSVIRIGARTGVRKIHGRRRHGSSHSSTTSSSSSRSSSSSSRSSGESREERDRNGRRGRTQKKEFDTSGGGRSIAVVDAVSGATATAQKVGERPVVSNAFSATKLATAAGGAPVGAERGGKCAVYKRASGRKGTLNGTMATAESAQRSESAVVGRSVAAVASVRRVPSNMQRPPTLAPATTAGRHYGVVSVRESTKEEDSSSEEEGSEESPSTEEKGKRMSTSGVAVAAIKTPTIGSTQQNSQQPHPATKKALGAKTRTADSTSEDSGSSAPSSEDSTSSSSDENEDLTSGGSSKDVRNLRGRMPAAVAQATAAAISRQTISTQRNEKKTNFDEERRTRESPAMSGLGGPRQLLSERAARRVEPPIGNSQTQTSATCSTASGGSRDAATGAGGVEKGASSREQGRYAKDKWSYRQQQEEKTRQRQQQQERQRQPLQPQYVQGQNRGPSSQLLSFKPWANPSLTAVQPGEWLRVRLLHLVGGMPTLDAWKTVFVEATDIHAGRIKLWELHQRSLLKRQGKRLDGNSSNDGCSHIGEEGQPSQEESVVRVPCEKQRGGSGRWLNWSELAYISTAATAEEDRAQRSASVAPAAALTAEVSATALPATASGDGSDKTGHIEKECSTDLSKTGALGGVTAKTAGSEGTGVLAAETLQRSAAPLRYLPRRLLSLRHQVSSNSEHSAAGGAAARSEPAASQNSSTESHEEAIGSPHRSSFQPGSPVAYSGSGASQSDGSLTVLSKEITGERAMVMKEVGGGTGLASCDSLPQQKTRVKPEGNGCGDLAFVGLSTTAAFSKIENSDDGAAPARGASSKMTVDVADSAAADKTGAEQLSTNVGGKASETRTEVTTAAREKAEWETLINSKLEIFLSDDGEAVLTSHPAAPTASFHLPLPRELVVECSRRLEAARRNCGNARILADSEVNSASASSGGDWNAANLDPPAQVNGAETDGMQPREPCTEEEPPQQQLAVEGSAKVNVGLAEEIADKRGNVLTDGASSSTVRTKRIIAAEDWKGFECVKACARRVVGEQLQHIRRAVRRQVDYYFSPGNWQRDVFLRSRAVPICSTCNNSSFGSCSSDSSFISCAAEEAPARIQGQMETSSCLAKDKDNRQVTVSGPTAGSPSFSSAEAQERAAVGRDADREDLAVNLDDIMVFPRMRGLSRDRDFVAWCIKAGGGLHHVRLESRGETHWLVRNMRAETKRHGRIPAKTAYRT